MISNQILQNTIEGIKSISRVDLHVTDIDGKVVASTSHTSEKAPCLFPNKVLFHNFIYLI